MWRAAEVSQCLQQSKWTSSSSSNNNNDDVGLRLIYLLNTKGDYSGKIHPPFGKDIIKRSGA